MYNKWQSRRWWICVWAVVMTTGLIVWLVIRQTEAPGWVGIVINIFQIIIIGYIAANSMTKPKE
jgi:hypothetical protein